MATVFMNKIVEKIATSASEPHLRDLAKARANEVFNDAVSHLKEDFEESTVTQELDRGVGSPNISHTLRGGDATENLYSFIGFGGGRSTDEPTEAIRERLDPDHPNGPKLRLRGKEIRKTTVRYQFVADEPDREKIWEATPLPWAEDLSWAKKIEGDIPGFGSFLARSMENPPSYSEGGIQATVGGKPGAAPQKLRSASYVRPEGGYLQTMFRRFLARIKNATG